MSHHQPNHEHRLSVLDAIDSSSVTRRGALGTIAAAAVTVAGARPTDAAPAIDPIYAAIEAHRKAAAVEQAAWDEVNRLHELADISPFDERALTDGPNVAAWDAREKFAETVPTTLSGLRAMVVYADELEDENPEAFWDPGDRRLLETLATAVKALMK
jgi:hypothetical protein